MNEWTARWTDGWESQKPKQFTMSQWLEICSRYPGDGQFLEVPEPWFQFRFLPWDLPRLCLVLFVAPEHLKRFLQEPCQ